MQELPESGLLLSSVLPYYVKRGFVGEGHLSGGTCRRGLCPFAVLDAIDQRFVESQLVTHSSRSDMLLPIPLPGCIVLVLPLREQHFHRRALIEF